MGIPDWNGVTTARRFLPVSITGLCVYMKLAREQAAGGGGTAENTDAGLGYLAQGQNARQQSESGDGYAAYKVGYRARAGGIHTGNQYADR